MARANVEEIGRDVRIGKSYQMNDELWGQIVGKLILTLISKDRSYDRLQHSEIVETGLVCPLTIYDLYLIASVLYPVRNFPNSSSVPSLPLS